MGFSIIPIRSSTRCRAHSLLRSLLGAHSTPASDVRARSIRGATKRCDIRRGARVVSAHVTTPRSQSLGVHWRHRSSWRRRASHARRNRRTSGRRSAGARASARGGRFFAQPTGSRQERLQAARRWTTRARLDTDGSESRPRQTRRRRRDGGATRFVARRHTDNRQTHRCGSDDARTVHEQRRTPAGQRRRAESRPAARHADHI